MANDVIELTVRSSVPDSDHDVRSLIRCVTVNLPPVTVESYAGVNVNQCCPSALSEKCGRKKYGCVKSKRMPRSRDDHRPCARAVRAPPRKFTWRYSASTRAFSSVP